MDYILSNNVIGKFEKKNILRDADFNEISFPAVVVDASEIRISCKYVNKHSLKETLDCLITSKLNNSPRPHKRTRVTIEEQRKVACFNRLFKLVNRVEFINNT